LPIDCFTLRLIRLIQFNVEHHPWQAAQHYIAWHNDSRSPNQSAISQWISQMGTQV
jgi:hypothetical protein